MSEHDSSGPSGPTEEELRRHQREAVTLVVEYEGADDLVADYTENLSTGGTFVNTSHDFAIGTDVQLVLSFPGLLAPIRLQAVVRWTRSGDGDVRGVGLEFTNMRGDDLALLERVVGQIESRDPNVVSRLCRVLVVEDNPHVAKLIRDGLRGSGKRAFGDDLAFNFRTASNGRDALDLLQTDQFDAIIIDIYMPILDGASVIEDVRATPSLAKMPIIAVSAGGERARTFAMAAGADFFLDKPMRLRQIIDTMQQLLQLRKE